MCSDVQWVLSHLDTFLLALFIGKPPTAAAQAGIGTLDPVQLELNGSFLPHMSQVKSFIVDPTSKINTSESISIRLFCHLVPGRTGNHIREDPNHFATYTLKRSLDIACQAEQKFKNKMKSFN